MFGAPEVHSLGTAHTFIDGKLGRFAALAGIPALNFLVGQSSIARPEPAHWRVHVARCERRCRLGG